MTILSSIRRDNTLGRTDLLVIAALAILWYGLVPAAGLFFSRHSWYHFRKRFNELRLRPILDYETSRKISPGQFAGEYRFSGSFESITGGRILWIRSEELTIPVDLEGSRAYMLPNIAEEEFPASFDPEEEVPERIHFSRLSALTGEARVYVGGALVLRANRCMFVSTAEKPLLVIFYEGPERLLTARVIRGGRQAKNYQNFVTPYALILGAFSQLMIAAFYITRPAFRETVISAFTALFIPLLPLVPPGILFVVLCRRFSWRARFFEAYRDLSRLPLDYLASGEPEGTLPGGGRYGSRQYETLPSAFYERDFPLIIPAGEKIDGDKWFVFGALNDDNAFPGEPADPYAMYGAFPGDPVILAKRYSLKAGIMNGISLLLLLLGIGINLIFIRIILILLGVI
ncbi:MAG: hypothetical protein LBF78_16120 [Treponema sp.]|nr:hypothetical protein [Treponema sp.]